MIRIMILMNQPACSICFRYPDVHNTVQETKMVSHRKRMKLMFPSTKMGWAQHHPATMTDDGCYFWYFGRWYCPKSLNTQYIYTYIHINLHSHTYISQTHKHSKWFLLFFRSKKHKNTNIFTTSNEGLHPQGEGLAFKANTGAQTLGAWHAKVLHRWCITCILDVDRLVVPVSRWYGVLRATAEETERCPVCWVKWLQHAPRLLRVSTRRRTEFMRVRHLLKDTVFHTWQSVPSFGVVFILGQIHWTLDDTLSFSRNNQGSLEFWSLWTAGFISNVCVWIVGKRRLFLLEFTHHELALVRSGWP